MRRRLTTRVSAALVVALVERAVTFHVTFLLATKAHDVAKVLPFQTRRRLRGTFVVVATTERVDLLLQLVQLALEQRELVVLLLLRRLMRPEPASFQANILALQLRYNLPRRVRRWIVVHCIENVRGLGLEGIDSRT